MRLALNTAAVTPPMLAKYCAIRVPSAYQDRGPRSYSVSLVVDQAVEAECALYDAVRDLFRESLVLARVQLRLPESVRISREVSPAGQERSGALVLRFKLPEFRPSTSGGRRASVPQAPRVYGPAGASGPLFEGEVHNGSRLAAYFTPEAYAFTSRDRGETVAGLRLRLDMIAVHDAGTPAASRNTHPDAGAYADPF